MKRHLTLATLIAATAVSSCGGGSGRSLLQLDVIGDSAFEKVTLRISDGGSIQAVFPQASFDSVIAYQAGFYLPASVTGTVHLTATADDGSCVTGRGAVDVPLVMSGKTSGPVNLLVTHTLVCEPLGDGGAIDAAADAPPPVEAGGYGGGGGLGGAGGGGGHIAATGGAGGSTAVDPDLVLWYPFDEASGTVAGDASGFAGGPRDGQLMTVGAGTAEFSTTHMVGTHALALSGGTTTDGGYVTLPSLLSLAPDAVTITVWVNVQSAVRFQKIFSFGNSEAVYMSLTTNSSRAAGVELEITTVGDTPGSEIIGATGLLTDSDWHHLAVVLPSGATYTGSLYLDDVLMPTTTMTLRPSDLGDTTQNYLGRSAITSTAYANVLLDDFRIYRRALTASEIAAIYELR